MLLYLLMSAVFLCASDDVIKCKKYIDIIFAAGGSGDAVIVM